MYILGCNVRRLDLRGCFKIGGITNPQNFNTTISVKKKKHLTHVVSLLAIQFLIIQDMQQEEIRLLIFLFQTNVLMYFIYEIHNL